MPGEINGDAGEAFGGRGDAAKVDKKFVVLRQYMVDRVASVESQVTCAEPGVPALGLLGRAALGLLVTLAAGFALRSRRRTSGV